MLALRLTAAAALLAAPAFADAPVASSDLPENFVTERDEYGETNPEELTLRRTIRRATEGEADMVLCSGGYLVTKAGSHEEARRIFESCVAAGYTQAMTWMSYMNDNGFGAPEDPDEAARYDRMAAEAGDPVGQFNYGLDLMRGRGVPRDEAAGRALVDQAAEAGLDSARRLQGADYDLDEVTPDADNWKYQPVF